MAGYSGYFVPPGPPAGGGCRGSGRGSGPKPLMGTNSRGTVRGALFRGRGHQRGQSVSHQPQPPGETNYNAPHPPQQPGGENYNARGASFRSRGQQWGQSAPHQPQPPGGANYNAPHQPQPPGGANYNAPHQPGSANYHIRGGAFRARGHPRGQSGQAGDVRQIGPNR
jgi:hypothetical protein